MQNRFFTDKVNFLSINHSEFIAAVTKGDSKTIDAMLAAKNAGANLNINEAPSGVTALEILLARKDFENAKKLLTAGALTQTPTKTWVSDDNSCYPYGYYEYSTRDLFVIFAKERDVIAFLVKEADTSYAPLPGSRK